MNNIKTGWFGRPGGPSSQSTLVHLVDIRTRKPVCGCAIAKDKQFQMSANGIHMAYVECLLCHSSRHGAYGKGLTP